MGSLQGQQQGGMMGNMSMFSMFNYSQNSQQQQKAQPIHCFPQNSTTPKNSESKTGDLNEQNTKSTNNNGNQQQSNNGQGQSNSQQQSQPMNAFYPMMAPIGLQQIPQNLLNFPVMQPGPLISQNGMVMNVQPMVATRTTVNAENSGEGMRKNDSWVSLCSLASIYSTPSDDGYGSDQNQNNNYTSQPQNSHYWSTTKASDPQSSRSSDQSSQNQGQNQQQNTQQQASSN
eukprot:UN29179